MRLKSLFLGIMLLAWTGSAYAVNPPTLTVGNASYTAGGTVTVPITLVTNGAQISMLALEINYDPALLSHPVGALGASATAANKALTDNVDAATGIPMQYDPANPLNRISAAGKYRFILSGGYAAPTAVENTGNGGSFPGASSVLTDGVVLNITFTIAGNASGAITLNNTFSDASDPNANSVIIAGASGTLTAGKTGDCNNDGRVSAADVQYAINIVIGRAGYTYNNRCDVNLVSGVHTPDGRTSAADVQTLINVIIGRAGYVLP